MSNKICFRMRQKSPALRFDIGELLTWFQAVYHFTKFHIEIYEFRNNAAVTAFRIRAAWVNIRRKKEAVPRKSIRFRTGGQIAERAFDLCAAESDRWVRILKAIRRVDVSTCRKCRYVWKAGIWKARFGTILCKFAYVILQIEFRLNKQDK